MWWTSGAPPQVPAGPAWTPPAQQPANTSTQAELRFANGGPKSQQLQLQQLQLQQQQQQLDRLVPLAAVQ